MFARILAYVSIAGFLAGAICYDVYNIDAGLWVAVPAFVYVCGYALAHPDD